MHPRNNRRLGTASSQIPAFLAAFALSATIVLSAGAAAQADDSRALYARAVGAAAHVSYSGTLTSVVYDEDDRATSTVTRIEHKAPNSWRIWYLAPADAYGRMIVSNESLTYQYEPSRNRVISHDWEQTGLPVAQPVDVDRIESNYSVETGPTSSVAGRTALTLSLVSKYTGTLVQRLWVDEKTKLILRQENYSADGSVGSKSSFDNIRIGGDVPNALFDLTVPHGMTLVQGPSYGKSTTDTSALVRSLSFTFTPPKYLPNGFSLEHGSIVSHGGVKTVEFVYGDGLRTFSLFENATGRLPRFDQPAKSIGIGDMTGTYADIAGQTLVSWNAGGLNFTIVGDLTAKEIARIGASIHP